MTEEELDEAKIGVHSVDSDPVNPIQDKEKGEFDAKFEIETEAVFKRLARDIYETDGAGIREPLTNAVTAVLQAVNYDYIERDEGVVEIKVSEDGDGTRLSIRDNGVGMTMEKIQKIVAVIGASEARDIGDLAGQFGMGFLAIFRLVGLNGGFEMHTNARYSDEDAISGMWKSGGFTKDDKGVMNGGLKEGDYGTEFNLFPKKEISRTDIREWVDRYGEWARVPIVYEETVNGQLEFEENYGGFSKDFTDYYDENRQYVEYEDEYVYATSSPQSEGRTILLDVPCKRQGTSSISTMLGSVDIRLKDENGAIMHGPNEGKMVVSDGEYDSMGEDRKNDFIPKREVHRDDIVLPKPTGTRRVLDSGPDFWRFIKSKLDSKIKDRISSIMSGVSNLNDLLMLSEPQYRMICLAAAQNVRRRYRSGLRPKKTGSKVQNWFSKNTDVQLDDMLSKQIAALVRKIRFVEEGCHSMKKRKLDSKKPAMAVYRANQNGGDIYMACRPTEDKCKIIWEDSDYNYLFRVHSTDEYKTYEDLLGWKKMKDIGKNNIDEFDVDEETKSSLLNVTGNSKDRSKTNSHRLTLHIGDKTKKMKVSEIDDKMSRLKSGEKVSIRNSEIENLILFPSHKDKKVSNYYWACDRCNPVAKCRKKDWEKLKKYDVVQTIDERVEEALNTKFTTADGLTTINEFEKNNPDSENIIFHVIDDAYLSEFKKDKHISKAETYVNDNFGGSETQFRYAPVSIEKFYSMKPSVINHYLLWGDSKPRVLSRYFRNRRKLRVYRLKSDTRMYATIRLWDWRGDEVYETLYSTISSCSLDGGGYSLVETVRDGLVQE